MADHSKPTITSAYSNFVTEMDARYDDLAVGLDPASTTATNVPTNSIRWNLAVNKWQKYNGSAWNDLSSLFSINISGNAGSVTNGVYTNTNYANPTFITSLSGSKITGDISGNSGSATKLATARNINGVPFDGTAAISLNTNSVATFNNSGTGVSSGTTFNGSTARIISYNTIGAPSTTGTNASGTWAISVGGSSVSLATTSWRVVESSSQLRFNDVSGNTKLSLHLTDGPTITSTAALGLPVGTQAQRPTGVAGKIRFNSTVSKYEGHNGAAWSSIGGGATGGGSDEIFFENSQTVNSSYSLTTNRNAMSAGPITVATGVVITVPSGSVWTVV
jgi:hypothetical protein